MKLETRPLFPRVRAALADLLGNLGPGEWSAPTVCEGWDVKDLALHVLGIEVGNVSRSRDGVGIGPPSGTSLAEWLDAFNEEWVRAARRLSPRLLRELLDLTGEMFESHLATLDGDEVTAHVSWASDAPVPVWLDIAREYTERWVHQQQIRDATDRPGLKEPELLGPVLQTFVHALPKTFEKIVERPGVAVELRVLGLGGGTWHIASSDSGWELSPGEHPKPAALVTTDADNAWRVFTRNPQAHTVDVQGDERLGRTVDRALAIIA